MISSEADLGSLEYGPQTNKILDVLAKLADPQNEEVHGAMKWLPFPQHISDNWQRCEGIARKASASTGRSEAWDKAFADAEYVTLAYATETGQRYWDLGWSVQAIVVEDLVGDLLSQVEYEVLTYDIATFLAVVDKTAARSSKRSEVCQLLSSGVISGDDAVTVVERTEEYSNEREILCDLLLNGACIEDALTGLQGSLVH